MSISTHTKAVRYGAASLALAVSGCASQIMEQYVGKSLVEPMLAYGPPAAAFDMDRDTRAFVWQISHSVVTVPARTTTTGTFNSNGAGANLGGYVSTQSSGFFNANTYYQPPQTANWTCSYVLLAKRNGLGVTGPASWTVTGYRKPSLNCE